MNLENMKVRPVWGAAGVQGFFGEGYWFHRYLHFFGMFLFGITFVSKTTTYAKNKGNMPLKEDGITPLERFPKCIEMNFLKRTALNAVSLSGPGFLALVKTRRWQSRTKPFFISFMAVGDILEDRMFETRSFAQALMMRIYEFNTEVGIQLNVSCPNTGAHAGNIIDEADALLDILQEVLSNYFVKVIVKLGPLTSPEEGKKISDHFFCAGLCVFNTLPFDSLSDPNKIRLFGSIESPLKKRGFKQSGGVSGKEIFKLLIPWLKEARRIGITKHINAGGGIFGPISAIKAFRAGADSIYLGTIVTFRPWAVLPTILTAHIMNWLKPNHSKE